MANREDTQPMLYASLSHLSCCILAGFAILLTFTFSLSTIDICYNGRDNAARMRMVIFATIVLTLLYIGITMVVAKRTLLAGIYILLIGFALLMRLDDLIHFT
jgi:membrane-anchored protein YejM (alkaline phosphatase superfamily)